METAHLEELIKLEDNYWWHVAKQRLATSLLRDAAQPPALIVEGGIGAAGNLLRWQALGYRVAGLDIMPEAVANAVHRGIAEVHQHDLHQPWPFPDASADVVVLLDVLEHLADPTLALKLAAQILRPSGKIIFTVPAYPSLYSPWDERLGHFRRYTPAMLEQQVLDAGLVVNSLRHWNAFSLPAALAVRTLQRWRPQDRPAEFPRVSRWLNRSLVGLAGVENAVARHCGLPCGLSLVGVIGK